MRARLWGVLKIRYGRGWPLAWVMLAAVGVLATVGCSSGGPPAQSAEFQAGQELFQANCSACHGLTAAGTNLGPPLVHDIYRPGHHSDASFHNAVQNGVPSHHWFFGDMAPVPNLTEGEVDQIICYVRTLQRDSGMDVKPSC